MANPWDDDEPVLGTGSSSKPWDNDEPITAAQGVNPWDQDPIASNPQSAIQQAAEGVSQFRQAQNPIADLQKGDVSSAALAAFKLPVAAAAENYTALLSGAEKGGEGINMSAQLLAAEIAGDELIDMLPQNREASFQQPFNMGDVNPLTGLPKLAYMVGESSPMIIGSVAAGPAGPVAAPVIAAAQQYGPDYAQLVAEGKSPQQAKSLAKVSAGLAATGAAVGYKLAGKQFGENVGRNVALQLFAVQPGVNVAENSLRNEMVYDRPWHEAWEQAYIGGTAIGVGFHLVGRRAQGQDKTVPIQEGEDPSAPDGKYDPNVDVPPSAPDDGVVGVFPRTENQLAPPAPKEPVTIEGDAVTDTSESRRIIPEFIKDRINAKLKGNMEEPTQVPRTDDLYSPTKKPEDYRQEITSEGSLTPEGIRQDMYRPYPVAPVEPRKEIGVAQEEYIKQGTANDPDAYTGEINRQRSQSLQSGTDFLMKAFQKEDGASETFDAVYSKYKERAGKSALGQPEFRNMIRDFGYRVDKIAGASRVIGVKLRELPAIQQEGNIAAFPGTELPKFPKGPAEFMSGAVENVAKDRTLDSFDRINMASDSFDTRLLNAGIDKLKRKWDERIEKKKEAAAQGEGHGYYVQRTGDGKTRLLNPTDAEEYMSRQGNLAQPMEWISADQVDARNVVPDITDMPIYYHDPRVLDKGTLPEAQLQNNLYSLADGIQSGNAALAKSAYDNIVNSGFKAAPSPGRSLQYNGELRGQVGPDPYSTRAEHVMIRNQEGARASLPPGPTKGLKTFDYARVEDLNEHFTSLEIGKLREVDWPLAKIKEYGDAVNQHDVFALVKMAKQGFKIPVVEGPGLRAKGDMLLYKPLPDSAVVDAYGGAAMKDRLPRGEQTFKMQKGQVEVSMHPDVTPELRAKTFEVTDIVNKLKPVIDRHLKKYGVRTSFKFEVIDKYDGRDDDVSNAPQLDEKVGAYIIVSQNRIVIPVDTILDKAFGTYGDVRADTLNAILHEVGHAVTIRSWYNLPHALQVAMQNAYHRELLKANNSDDVSSYQTTFDPEHSQSSPYNMYHLSFVEWKAEQFRRLLTSDKRFLKDLNDSFGEAARSQEDLVQLYMKAQGPYKTAQRFTASHEFHRFADYLEAMAHKNDPKISMSVKEQMDKYDYDFPDDTRIKDTVDQIKAILSEEWVSNLRTDNTSIGLDRSIPTEESLMNEGFNMASIETTRAGKIMRMMVGAIAWHVDPAQRDIQIRRTMHHEFFHGIENLLTAGQRKLLGAAARARGLMTPGDIRVARESYQRIWESVNGRNDPEGMKKFVDDKMDREAGAWLAEEYDRIGIRYSDEVNGILDKIQRTAQRIYNMMKGQGYNTAEDIMHSFFRGELTKRYNQQLEMKAQRRAGSPFRSEARTESKIAADLGDGYRAKYVHDDDLRKTRYSIYGKDNQPAGYVEIRHKADGPYIEYISTRNHRESMRLVRKGKDAISVKLLKYAQEHLGVPLKAASEFTEAGYRMAKRISPELVKGYQQIDGLWYSPKYIKDHYLRAARDLNEAVQDQWDKQSLDFVKAAEKQWKAAYEKLPEGLFEDPALSRQWSRREFSLSDWEKSRRMDADYARSEITGQRRVEQDEFAKAADDKATIEEILSAKRNGTLDGEASSMESQSMRDVFGNKKLKDKYKVNLTGQTFNDVIYNLDVISWMKSNWYTMKQLAWKNPQVSWLRRHVALTENQVQRAMEWVARSSETARAWEKLPGRQSEGLAKMMFWATEMKFRTRAEVLAKTVRNPTRAEVLAEARRLGLGADAVRMFDGITKDFGDFLTQMETVFTAQIRKQFANNPQDMAKALAKLTADMNAMRQKPYFPMTRFGKYVVHGKDPVTGKTTWFSAYESQASRDAASAEIAAANPQWELRSSTMPEGVQDFQGLPKPLLDRMLDANTGIPGLSQLQREWIQRFTHQASPENSFRKRWLEREGTPGYSLDGIRAYADYFRRGSSYLARLEFRDAIQENFQDARKEINSLAWADGRELMYTMMERHYDKMNKPGGDYHKWKAFSTHYFLGFSPAAAFVNITQVPMVTAPYLTKLFGVSAIGRIGKDSMASVRRAWFDPSARGNQDFVEAHAELVARGKIDGGQASDLGMYADNNNMNRSFAGSTAQKFWRGASTASMFMFGKVERFNREWTFETAYKAALENPNSKHVQDIRSWYGREINDLRARRPGMSQQAAEATFVAIQAIDRTQFDYASWDRPPFMNNPVIGTTMVFMNYVQQLLFHMGNSPGGKGTLLLMGLAYGLQGLPGAEDLDNIILAVGRKIFGVDWSPSKFLREKTNELTQGGPLEHTGADLLLNGFSRYGFGIGLLPEGMGAPRFDASASGSMGELVPGLSPAMKAWGNSGGPQDESMRGAAEVFKDAAGAGYGPGFAMWQLMNSAPGGDSWRKWEGVLPRAFKAVAKGYRYIEDGAATDARGNKIAKMDWNDPDDKWTIAAQFAGFTPTKVSQVYDRNALFYSEKAFYMARKNKIMIDIKTSMESGDPDRKKAILQDINNFNAELKSRKMESMAITKKTVSTSLRTKAKNAVKTEMGLPAQKMYQPLAKRADEMFPSVKSERVR
jgi:hypothetical protein